MRLRRFHVTGLCAGLVLGLLQATAHGAEPTWPAAREIWIDPFEGPGLNKLWEDQGKGKISVAAAAAHPPSASGLSVDVTGESQAYLQRFNLTEWPHLLFPRDTYVRFSFHPNGVSIPANDSVVIAMFRDADWNEMVGLRLRQEGAGYSVVIELPDGTLDTTALPMTNDWHTITVGCRMHDWVGAWVDDAPRVVHGVQHAADYVTVLLPGKPGGNWNGTTPTGTVYFDDLAVMFAAYKDLWVDASKGVDTAEGTSADAPLRTINAATTLASAGTTVHLAPGDYRESVAVPTDGASDKPLRIVATGGRNSARVMGSEPASSVGWVRLTDPGEIALGAGVDVATASIWKADLAAWALKAPPRFVVVRATDGAVTRLALAREPDWQVQTEWKNHVFWWDAEGGTAPSACDPVAQDDCDIPERSDRYLVDYHSDTEPAGIEAGSLASLGDVTGATAYVKDCMTGFYMYRRRVAETPEAGKVRLEKLPEGYTEGCWFDHNPAYPALGLHSKYYLEGLSKFLDTPGEWYFNEASQTLYVWTPDGKSPDQAGVEISVRDTGVELSNRSWVELVNLDVELFQEDGIKITNGEEKDKSHGLTLSGLDIGWSTRGLKVAQGPKKGSADDVQIRGLTLRDSRIHDMESLGIYYWSGSGKDFARPGITDSRFFRNELARIGFRDNEQGSVAVGFGRADHLLFQANHVHHIAHTCVSVDQAQTSSTQGFSLPPEAILTGDILVKGNLFENCVLNAGDASGLGFWGALADYSHTFRDTLAVGNVSRNNIGYTWVSDKRQNWMYHGKGGMGYYINFAGGMHFFRNIAYNNGLDAFMQSEGWIDQPVVIANNTFAGSVNGYSMSGDQAYSKQNVGFDSVNNIFLHLRRFAMGAGDPAVLKGKVSIDNNLYHLVGWEPWPQHTPGILAGDLLGTGYQEIPTLEEVRSKMGFELHGVSGDPKLAGFDPSVEDGTWQDFRLTASSDLAIDKGQPLPAPLAAVLTKFSIDPGQKGAALDIGAIEFDPANPNAPFAIDVGPSDGTEPIPVPWTSAAGGSSGAGGGSAGGDAGPQAEGEGSDGGCGCSTPGSRSIRPGWLLLAGLTFAAVLKRKRRSPACS